MDLGKILERKGLESRRVDNTARESYLEERFMEFRGYKIPVTEYVVLDELASELGIGVEGYREGIPLYIDDILGARIEIKDSHVTGLQIALYSLDNLPDSIGNLAQLKKLDIRGTGLESLPEAIGNLEELESLYLFLNRLACLPDSVGNLKKLRQLLLYENRLNSLPDSMSRLEGLEKIRLSSGARFDEKSLLILMSLKKMGAKIIWD